VATCPTNGFRGHKTEQRYYLDSQGTNRTKVLFRQYFRVPSKERESWEVEHAGHILELIDEKWPSRGKQS
jgi:hypothetical protein